MFLSDIPSQFGRETEDFILFYLVNVITRVPRGDMHLSLTVSCRPAYVIRAPNGSPVPALPMPDTVDCKQKMVECIQILTIATLRLTQPDKVNIRLIYRE